MQVQRATLADLNHPGDLLLVQQNQLSPWTAASAYENDRLGQG